LPRFGGGAQGVQAGVDLFGLIPNRCRRGVAFLFDNCKTMLLESPLRFFNGLTVGQRSLPGF